MRYIRLNPRFNRDETVMLLEKEINEPDFPILVPWLASDNHQLQFFAIPSNFSLNSSAVFREGRIYGMDVTSGAAVAALLFDEYDLDKIDRKSCSCGKLKKESLKSLRVLDLCCAPGNVVFGGVANSLKLCTIADLVPPSSVVVGVDISKQRISLCKNIIKKYHIDDTTSTLKSSTTPQKGDENFSNAEKHGPVTIMNDDSEEISSPVTLRLYCADGTTFGAEQQSISSDCLVFDSNIAAEEVKQRGKRKRLNKSARAREKRNLLELHHRLQEEVKTNEGTANVANAAINSNDKGETINLCSSQKQGDFSQCGVDSDYAQIVKFFDRVLVDAECSTDGAVRHFEKRRSYPSNQLCSTPAWNESNISELVDLQRRLIDSGFNLLRKGGILVYSTCSLSTAQNEEVVQWLLDNHDRAFIIAVSFKRSDMTQEQRFMREGSLKGTVRFLPSAARDSINTKEAMVGQERDRTFSGGGFFLAKIGKA
ncbi:hypothetical protein ACHAXS_001516 [Conticribra weissflogii]